jgi:hypothetical protein
MSSSPSFKSHNTVGQVKQLQALMIKAGDPTLYAAAPVFQSQNATFASSTNSLISLQRLLTNNRDIVLYQRQLLDQPIQNLHNGQVY